jgi:hypothetical protein
VEHVRPLNVGSLPRARAHAEAEQRHRRHRARGSSWAGAVA